MDILKGFANMVREMLVDWPLGTIIGVLFVGVCIVLIGWIVCGLFVAIDLWFLPRNRKTGRVIGKLFTPARIQITTVPNAATGGVSPYLISHPNHWSVTVAVGDQQDSMSVSKKIFDSLSENDPVLVECVSGRFSGDLYIKALSLM